jgi:RimJ/RimL family protein N-acetyltransferase
MIKLETDRLYLREFIEDDAQFFYELNNDPEVIRYTGDVAFKNKEEALALIRNYDQYKSKTGRLTVVLKETGELLGWCGLKFHPENDQTDLGYRFKKVYWNKGYATEAARASLQYGFDTLHLPYIVATAQKENIASIKIMEKLGMHFWKEVVEHEVACVIYRIDSIM